MQKNEIVITRNNIALRSMAGREFVVNKIHYDTIRKAISTSKQLFKSGKHKIIQVDLDSWNDQKIED